MQRTWLGRVAERQPRVAAALRSVHTAKASRSAPADPDGADSVQPSAATLDPWSHAELDAFLATTRPRLAELLRELEGRLPGTAQAFLQGEGGDRATLNALFQEDRYPQSPLRYLSPLSLAIFTATDDPAVRRLLAARAVSIADSLGKLNRPPELGTWERVKGDLKLAVAGKSLEDVRALFESFEALPPELVFTVALRVKDPDDRAWLCNAFRDTQSQRDSRALRDVVFYAVAFNRLDLLTAFRCSPSTSRARKEAMHYIAQEYVQQRARQLPLKRLINGLLEGGDPATELREEADRVALAKMGLDTKTIGSVAPAGLEELRTVAHLLGPLSAALHTPARQFGDAPYAETFDACLKAVAEGRWPNYRYEGPVASEQLRALSERQRAEWRRGAVSPFGLPAPAEAPRDFGQARPLAAGLAKLLEGGLQAFGGTAPDPAAVEAEIRKRTERLDAIANKLRHETKGCDPHRRLSAEAGPLSDERALLELYASVQRFATSDSDETIRALRVAATRAEGPLRKGAGSEAVAAAQLLMRELPETEKVQRCRDWVADEDTLEALLDSHRQGSCLWAIGGANRHGLVTFLADPMYRMSRVYRDGKPVARGMLRLVEVELDGYKGPALFADQAMTLCGRTAPLHDQKQMYRHALERGRALGVPVLTNQWAVRKANTPVVPSFQEVASERGAQALLSDATLELHRGHTGLHHGQNLGKAYYFLAFSPATSERYVKPEGRLGNVERGRIELECLAVLSP